MVLDQFLDGCLEFTRAVSITSPSSIQASAGNGGFNMNIPDAGIHLVCTFRAGLLTFFAVSESVMFVHAIILSAMGEFANN